MRRKRQRVRGDELELAAFTWNSTGLNNMIKSVISPKSQKNIFLFTTSDIYLCNFLETVILRRPYCQQFSEGLFLCKKGINPYIANLVKTKTTRTSKQWFFFFRARECVFLCFGWTSPLTNEINFAWQRWWTAELNLKGSSLQSAVIKTH